MPQINTETTQKAPEIGHLALFWSKRELPLQVLRSNAGFYVGTFDDGPCSRESNEYFPTQAKAQLALDTGDWTQKSISDEDVVRPAVQRQRG